MDDPCDDWHRSFSYSVGRMMRHATGTDYNPQFDLCDECSHWNPAMTDPTPTHAEVTDERLIERLRDMGIQCCDLAADRIPALRERAEAAEAEREILKAAVFGSTDYWTSLPIGNFCEMARTTEAARKEALDQLTAARRAEDAAWNDAIEAAVRVTLDRQGRRAMGDGHGNSSYDIGVSDAANAIRALRRAAPTEGEAQSLDDTTRAVLDRAERIVAGQSQQEQRTAEIFLRPTEGEA